MAAALVACGGHEADTPVPATTPHATEAAATVAVDGLPARVGLGVMTLTPPLLDDAGEPMPSDPRAQPADAAAWTVAGRYATARQARHMLAVRDDAMPVNVRCCGIEAADEAVGIAFGMQASGIANDTPVLVAGDELRLAASVANRLTRGGMTRVWLVTP